MSNNINSLTGQSNTGSAVISDSNKKQKITKSTQPQISESSSSDLYSHLNQFTNLLKEANAYINQCTDANIAARHLKISSSITFEKHLNQWGMAQKSGEVGEAVRRIKEAFDSNATELSLDHLGLTSLPSVIGQLKLKILNLDWNHFKVFPVEILPISGLEELVLSGNLLKSVPSAISKLSKLKVLHLAFNGIVNLPSSINELSKLKTLNLEGNKIGNFPDILGLSELEVLFLGSNQLTNLPSAIDKLSKLTILDVSANKLKSLPLQMINLFRLQTLAIGKNPLENFPTWISDLFQLKRLSADLVGLTHFPVQICNLTRLEELDLSENYIQSLPQEVKNLRALTCLELRCNALSFIRNELGKLPSLTTLDLEGNETLSSLPPELSNCISLTSIDCNETSIPPQVVKEILEACKKLRNGGLSDAEIARYDAVRKELDQINMIEKKRRFQVLEPSRLDSLNQYLLNAYRHFLR